LAESATGAIRQPAHVSPNPRQLPLDMIFTATLPASCCMAVRSGLKYGLQSTKRLCANTDDQIHRVTFVDNDYQNYQHARHREVVKMARPKYATVRDVMTYPQCRAAKIKYYPLDQILEWAEDLRAYAEHVIVIPKYDCLDQIPDHFVLGYSIPSSHGGTPLPMEAFKGRPIHLLGGSWKVQLHYLAELGEDVISVDNNYISILANEYGCYVDPEGEIHKCNETPTIAPAINVAYIALAISMGNIGAKVNDITQTKTPDRVRRASPQADQTLGDVRRAPRRNARVAA